ncbi:MAG: hypothetical protein AB8U25_03125 [Rickettsiales endosymbiont of Dermacentor nuttalli]
MIKAGNGNDTIIVTSYDNGNEISLKYGNNTVSFLYFPLWVYY